MSLIVRERTREIGALKALGASRWHVVGQFGVEVLVLSGIAAVVATGLLALAGPAIAATFDLSGSGVLDTGDGPGGLRRGGELMREMGGSSVAGAIDPQCYAYIRRTLGPGTKRGSQNICAEPWTGVRPNLSSTGSASGQP